MCWNEQVSWGTFIVGTIFNILIAWYFDESIITLLCALFQWVIMMQFFEAIAWRNQPSKQGANPCLNKFAAVGGLIFNLTQPIILALGLILFTTVSMVNKVIAMCIVFLYICWIILALNSTKEFDHLTPSEGCRHLDLYWWHSVPYGAIPYIITLFSVILLLIQPVDLAWFEAVYIALTLILSAWLYSCGTGSVWCFFAVGAPIFTGLYWYFTHTNDK